MVDNYKPWFLKLFQVVKGARKDEKDIIYESPPRKHFWVEGMGVYMVIFELTHEDVGKSWHNLRPHCSALNLLVVFPIEFEIITSEDLNC